MATMIGSGHAVMADLHPDDQLVEDILDEALREYEGILPPAALALLREELGDRLAATAAGRQLLRQVHPDPIVTQSGDEVAPGVEVLPLDKKKSSGEGS